MRAEDKRLTGVAVNLNGPVDDGMLAAFRIRAARRACATQTLRFANGDSALGETCLVFEIYDGDSDFIQKCRHLLRKIKTAALGYIGRRDILVSVKIWGDPDRFPVNGAFQPAKSVFDSLGLTHEAGLIKMGEEGVDDIHSTEDYANAQI